MNTVPAIRIQACNSQPIRGDGEYVLYWMIASRRMHWNFALDRAIEWCAKLRKPLLIFEALRRDFPWAQDRIRRFVIDGMSANSQAVPTSKALYYPYVESEANQGKGLLAALAARAAVVVTDDFPCYFLPKMVAAAASHLPVLLEQVDSNGLLPLRASPKEFSTAYAFRRFLQKNLARASDEFSARASFNCGEITGSKASAHANYGPMAGGKLRRRSQKFAQKSGVAARRQSRRRKTTSHVSSPENLAPTTKIATSPAKTEPVAFPHTCISATFRRTKYLLPLRSMKNGSPNIWRSAPTAAAQDGGA